MGQFFSELKRRNVVRVGLAYAVVGWLVFQVGEVLFPTFGAPEWIFKSLILIIALGFPFALLFAWAFELTPQGIKKTAEVDANVSITPSTGKKLNIVTIVALVAALGYFIWERQSYDQSAEPGAGPAYAEDVASDQGTARPPGKRTIAVLPFVNMSSDNEQEWFADGLTEEILNSLARTPDLLVAARTSSFAYKGSNDDITKIADALGVAHILEGSVRRSGDRLRVTAQLIRASDGFHLWSETYDRSMSDLIDIQENVAFAIANALETAMDPDALASMVSAGTSSIPAFEAYLQGLAYGVSTLQTGDAYLFLSAKEAFERAVDLDPEFSKAYWRLANFWDVQLSRVNIISGLTDFSREEMMAHYEDAIDNAILFEEDEANSFFYRAHKARQELKLPQALRLNTEYLKRRPLDQVAQNLQLELLAMQSPDEEIIKAVKTFAEVDGHDVVVTQASITRLLFTGDNAYLREFAKQAADQFPDQAFVQYQAHRGLLWAGDIDGATQLMPTILSSDLPEDSRYLVLLRQACAENRIDDARRMYERGLRQFAGDYSIVWLSHLIMGDSEAAVATLQDLDTADDLAGLADFLTYGYLDVNRYPNLQTLLENQGIRRGETVVPPYRCKT